MEEVDEEEPPFLLAGRLYLLDPEDPEVEYDCDWWLWREGFCEGK